MRLKWKNNFKDLDFFEDLNYRFEEDPNNPDLVRITLLKDDWWLLNSIIQETEDELLREVYE